MNDMNFHATKADTLRNDVTEGARKGDALAFMGGWRSATTCMSFAAVSG